MLNQVPSIFRFSRELGTGGGGGKGETAPPQCYSHIILCIWTQYLCLWMEFKLDKIDGSKQFVTFSTSS